MIGEKVKTHSENFINQSKFFLQELIKKLCSFQCNVPAVEVKAFFEQVLQTPEVLGVAWRESAQRPYS